MWLYEQKTGLLRSEDNGISLIAKGYSGFGEGKNNPAMQNAEGVGPIPVGNYTIGVPYDSPHTGPFTMSLTPAPANEMYGRSEMKMHGDSIQHPGSASHGCIIMPRPVRERVWNSGDHQLQVISGEDSNVSSDALAA